MADLVNDTVNDWRKYLNEVIDQLENVLSKQVRLLCYFLLMESIAQDIAHYPDRGQQKTFIDFVLKYQTMYSYLELIDPVTFFYHVEKYFDNAVDLSDFIEGSNYRPKDRLIRDKAVLIREALSEIVGEEKAHNIANKHRYVDLLYRLDVGFHMNFRPRIFPFL